MASAALDSGGLLGRIIGVTAFVCLLPPFGLLTALIAQQELKFPGAPVFIAIILLVCAHIFLFTRAYYALKISGIVVFSIVYLLLAYTVMVLFGFEVSANNANWYVAAYLSLLYSYGLCFNFIDSFLSGLLHTKSV